MQSKAWWSSESTDTCGLRQANIKGAAWHNFLLDSENKQQLFEYLSEEMRRQPQRKNIIY